MNCRSESAGRPTDLGPTVSRSGAGEVRPSTAPSKERANGSPRGKVMKLGFSILVLGLLVSSGSAMAQAPRLHPEYLGAFMPYRLSEAGQIIGNDTVGGNRRAFVVEPGQARFFLPLPAGMASSVCYDINDFGVVVGQTGPHFSPEFDGRAIAWDPDGSGGYTYRLLGALPGQVQASAAAVNNLGDIVGYSTDGTYRYAALFTGASGVESLHASGIFDPVDINDDRVLVDASFTVKRMDLDTMVAEDLGTPPGDYVATRAAAINGAGQVGGQAILSTSGDADRVAARYTDGVGWEVYSAPGTGNAVVDLNEQGDGVMIVYTGSYVRYDGGGTYLVEDLIENTVGHWYVSYLSGLTMNSSGWIAVFATNDVTGQAGTLLLRPEDPSGLGGEDSSLSETVRVSSRPDPFHESTRISYELPSEARVDLEVVDVAGRIVRRLLTNETQIAGSHVVDWDGHDGHGMDVSAGVYFVRVRAGGEMQTGRITRVR